MKFVWSPNESDFPDRPGNHLEDYWPGTDYVDIAGFDAYNWTNAEPRRGDGDDRSFDEIVQGPYQRVAEISAGKDIWLCEFGTVELGKQHGSGTCSSRPDFLDQPPDLLQRKRSTRRPTGLALGFERRGDQCLARCRRCATTDFGISRLTVTT